MQLKSFIFRNIRNFLLLKYQKNMKNFLSLGARKFHFPKYKNFFSKKYKKFFNLGARKFHFSKHKKFFQNGFFYLWSTESSLLKYKKFFKVGARKFYFQKIILRKYNKFSSLRARKFRFLIYKKKNLFEKKIFFSDIKAKRTCTQWVGKG